MLARMAFFVSAFTFSILSGALAQECDNLHTYPHHTGHSLEYNGTSQIRAPDSNKLTAWQCFFLNTGFLKDVIVSIVDAKGNHLPNFESTGVNINRSYYFGQAAVTVGFRAPANLKPSDLFASYKIVFEQDEPLFAGHGAIACGSTNQCVEVKANGDWRIGNPRSTPEKSGNLYSQAPNRNHSFTAYCSEPEWCVVLDDEGGRWQGSIRNHGNQSDFPTGP